MATTITNDASTSYNFVGSSDVLTVSSNTNSLVLQDSQGISLVKTSSSPDFAVGEIITYTVQITNTSGKYFNGVRIIDNLGGGNLAYVLGSASLTIGSLTYPVTPVATNPLTFTLQELSSGATMTLRYNVQVIFNLPASVQSITNTVQGIGYTSTGTVTGFASNTIQKKTNGDLTLAKSSSQASVLPNQNFSYLLTLSNNTNIVAEVQSITDQLPANFILTGVYVKVGAGINTQLLPSEYELNGTNLLIIPSASGPNIIVPANGTTLVTITGYFS